MQLDFQINGQERLSRNIMTFARDLGSMDDFFSEAIDVVEKFHKEAFASGGKPDPWKALAPSTVKAREKRWGYYKRTPKGTPGTLHWTGRLQESNQRTIGKDFGKFEKKASYAPFHQYGGSSGRPPQRKMLTLDPRAAAEIVKKLQEKIQRVIGNYGLQA